MKLSEKLYDAVRPLWAEAADKSFVKEMAAGTLSEPRFRNYMMQDYLYLLEYIDILKKTLSLTDDPALTEFLRGVIEETENETYRVHVPNMKKAGVSEEELAACEIEPVIDEYTGFMRGRLDEEGLLAGLTALLQCSWVYAFIGETLTNKYAKEISASPYRSWFEAYTCSEYTESNRAWIETVDKEAAGICKEEEEKLCAIFKTCAEFENRFWDVL